MDNRVEDGPAGQIIGPVDHVVAVRVAGEYRDLDRFTFGAEDDIRHRLDRRGAIAAADVDDELLCAPPSADVVGVENDPRLSRAVGCRQPLQLSGVRIDRQAIRGAVQHIDDRNSVGVIGVGRIDVGLTGESLGDRITVENRRFVVRRLAGDPGVVIHALPVGVVDRNCLSGGALTRMQPCAARQDRRQIDEPPAVRGLANGVRRHAVVAVGRIQHQDQRQQQVVVPDVCYGHVIGDGLVAPVGPGAGERDLHVRREVRDSCKCRDMGLRQTQAFQTRDGLADPQFVTVGFKAGNRQVHRPGRFGVPHRYDRCQSGAVARDRVVVGAEHRCQVSDGTREHVLTERDRNTRQRQGDDAVCGRVGCRHGRWKSRAEHVHLV